ncbi:hypothetical protein [Rurimicrobium arvi]|uniref:hypothetical protein n=1 Tax=Rurimicrobium arvi TaxID=2049916 RepID=UPI0031DFFA87
MEQRSAQIIARMYANPRICSANHGIGEIMRPKPIARHLIDYSRINTATARMNT